MPMAEELARGALPLAVLLDEDLERAQQLVAVFAAAVLERPEHAVAEEAQRVVVLEREQQLEGTEVAVGGDMPVAVAVRRGERGRLEGTARLVEAAPQRCGRRDPARCRAWVTVALRDRLARPAREVDRLEVGGVDHRAQEP